MEFNLETFYIVAFAFLGVSLVVLIVIAVKLAKQKEKIRNLTEELRKLNEEKEDLKNQKDLLSKELSEAKSEIARLDTLLDLKEKELHDKIELMRENQNSLKNELKTIANDIIKNAKEELSSESKRSISEVLSPLKFEIKDFKSSLFEVYESELKSISFLRSEISSLKELNETLANEARNLAKAFSADKKLQGIWGEMVLKKVLELSGLREGVEFQREVVFGNKRVDVLINLPQNRHIIIDAKTTLNAYQKYINTQDEIYLKEHIKHIKNRIDELSGKKYENIELNSVDFVLMFVPVEAALNAALEKEPGLYEYAYKKRIMLVTPSTLLIALRAIDSALRSQRQVNNLKAAIKKADDIYQKATQFIEEFERIQNSINSLQKTYESANAKLKGRQGLLYQVDRFKELMDLN